jgi:hypothetical protein
VTLSPFLARIVLVVLALAAIHVPMIPVSHAADRLPVPDLLFCLLAAWVVRRPERLPLLLVVALGLLADLLQARPVGPGALGLVLATEVLRIARPAGGSSNGRGRQRSSRRSWPARSCSDACAGAPGRGRRPSSSTGRRR